MFKGPELQKSVNQSYCFCVLHVVSWCFHEKSGMVFNLQNGRKYMVEMAMFKGQ